MRRLPKCLLVALLALPLAQAAAPKSQPVYFTAAADYRGTGRHPQEGEVGLIVNRSVSGEHLVCFSYVVFTEKRITGRVRVRVHHVSGEQERQIARLSSRIEEFPLPELPGLPEDLPPIGLGFATECRSTTGVLEKGDRLRWRVLFKRAPRLTSDFPSFSLGGELLLDPAQLGRSRREARDRALRRALEMALPAALGLPAPGEPRPASP